MSRINSLVAAQKALEQEIDQAVRQARELNEVIERLKRRYDELSKEIGKTG